MKQLGLAALQWYVRHFPISKGKTRLVSLLWKPLLSGHTQRQTVLRQADVKLECDLTKYIQRRLYFWGAYEEETCAYWIRLSKESRVIFDVGANVGLYSLLAAWANPRSEIHAFEPTPDLVAVLANNVRLNRMQNISIQPLAVGDSEKTGFLRLCAGSDGTNEGMNYVVGSMHEDSDLPVAVVSLDHYCQKHEIERIDLMKMDIEGGEYDALVGAQQLLQKQAINCIILELIDWAAERSGYSTYAIKRLLADFGYQLFRFGSRELMAVAAEDVTVGENVIAFANVLERRQAQERAHPKEASIWQLP